MSNPIHDLAETLGGHAVGERIELSNDLGDIVWLYPNAYGQVVLWAEPGRSYLSGSKPVSVVLKAEDVTRLGSALLRQLDAAEKALEVRRARS